MSCHVCQCDDTHYFGSYGNLKNVSSDCKPCKDHGELILCRRCCTLQKRIDRAFLSKCQEIYRNYAMYFQGGGAEQKVFTKDSADARPRSLVVLSVLLEQFYVPEQGRYLDIGCGTGHLLDNFHSMRPQWTLYGYELKDTYRKAVLARSAIEGFYSGQLSAIDQRFDMVSLFGCLEHIHDPGPFLEVVRTLLKDEGLLLIEVPNVMDNPFDLVVYDHCTHFSIHSLLSLLNRVGFSHVFVSTDLAPKEITVLARLHIAGAQASPSIEHMESTPDFVTASLRWLEKLKNQSEKILSGSPCIGIFGTSIAAVWLYSELD